MGCWSEVGCSREVAERCGIAVRKKGRQQCGGCDSRDEGEWEEGLGRVEGEGDGDPGEGKRKRVQQTGKGYTLPAVATGWQ
ncbi:hypothetical protein AMTR_s00028p00148940 [Amborella trichopoda]|uniref:Uncharacterized protein n=1 Tax=Amborella trichopoda TaxID=13333 RepID=W1PRY5_AMBTC|nr:hypothetical protein AMTR_s00028p00148940 [Amborella trichopoda]